MTARMSRSFDSRSKTTCWANSAGTNKKPPAAMAVAARSCVSLELDIDLPFASPKPTRQATNGSSTSEMILGSLGAVSRRFFVMPMTWTVKDASYLRPAPMASAPSAISLGATVSSAPAWYPYQSAGRPEGYLGGLGRIDVDRPWGVRSRKTRCRLGPRTHP